ncbi:hypothetical protein LJK87_12845 [Paenibacillus sp. P25]|nr:hypothetical protein LJK87_12845 [Paenibacillus sp. P25]
MARAFKEAGIDPRTISYLEAHGTGTSLGDPIEIAGLSGVFRQYTGDKQFCPIGSVKSNIGHCESAAGIAGLTKVLLQLKYKRLVPSLHSSVLNPNIDFADTPFVVQQELAEWKRPILETNGEIKEYPRIAGISSFGAGGSNAHLVIEEYIPRDSDVPAAVVNAQNPAIIVLSAKNEIQLVEQTQRLMAAIDEGQFDDSSLMDAAYTLQVGREAMEERLAVIVASVSELKTKLRSFIQDREQAEGVHYGQVKRNKDALSVFVRDEELEEAIVKWMQRKKYAKLVSLWVKGLQIDWSKLYGEVKPRRISLPTYPFAEERYWVPELDASDGAIVHQAQIGKESLPPAKDRPIRRRTCFLTKQWEPCETESSKEVSGTVAILADKETLALAALVSGHFAKSRIIDIGELEHAFGQTEDDWNRYEGCIDLVGLRKRRG